MKGQREIIIGLVGLPGAGKTTVANFLEKHGFTCVTLSDFIKLEAQKNGVTRFTREILQDYGNRMRSLHGPAVLAVQALETIHTQKADRVVIDGIRNVYEVKYLQAQSHFTLVGVTAHLKIRYERIRKRKGKQWVGTYEQFQMTENREEHLGSIKTGLRVSECFKKAAITIINEGTLTDLNKAVHRLISYE